ncbi:MAG: hypothetical protein QOK06_1280, partial [Acidimicrobiaceae bacterium]
GWAVDPDPDPPEPYQRPPTVHVYMDGQFLAPLVIDHARPDVAALVPHAGPNDGFEAALPARPGPHEVCVYAINRGRTGRNVTLGCRDLDVPAQSGDAPPRGSLDGLFGSSTGGTANYTLGVFGWAMTASGGEARVRILAVGGFYANGEATYDVTGPTGVSRPDVPAEIPGAPPDTGYEILAGGGHFFHYRLACAVAQSIATGDESVLGCVTTARLGGGYF